MFVVGYFIVAMGSTVALMFRSFDFVNSDDPRKDELDFEVSNKEFMAAGFVAAVLMGLLWPYFMARSIFRKVRND